MLHIYVYVFGILRWNDSHMVASKLHCDIKSHFITRSFPELATRDGKCVGLYTNISQIKNIQNIFLKY